MPKCWGSTDNRRGHIEIGGDFLLVLLLDRLIYYDVGSPTLLSHAKIIPNQMLTVPNRDPSLHLTYAL